MANKKPPQGAPPARTFFIAATVVVGGLLTLNILTKVPSGGTETEYSVPEDVTRKPLSDDEARGLAPWFDAAWKGEKADPGLLPERLRKGAAAVYVQVRNQGSRVGRPIWREGKSTADAMALAVGDARGRLGNDGGKADALEVVLAHSFDTIDPKGDKGKISNVRRGLRGIEFIYDKKVRRVGPTEMIATNRDFEKVIQVFEDEAGLGRGATNTGRVRTRIFEGDQMIVKLTPSVSVHPMFRGNELIPIEGVTKPSTQHLADTLSQYLWDNLQTDGRMVYKYWPSVGHESDGNNMIRQWMATVAMGRVARKNDEDPSNDDRALLDKVALNIDYNLAHFYHEEPNPNGEPFGVIEWEGKVKLGAIALAALSIIEHPDRAKWERHEKAIQRTIEHQWREDGYMKSFFKPSGYRDFHNFYPGEALLYWASLLEKDGKDTKAGDGTPLLDKYMKSVWYFKEWHLDNRNPAFIPWQTQAHYKVYQMTRDEKLRDWIFEMNDWLLGVQEWDNNPRFPDTNGRFYDPNRPFGPPHSSSTGVYLEGLIFAWKLAKETAETAPPDSKLKVLSQTRQENYRQSIMRGLRSCMQLTFFDDIDMFYVSKREPVKGGVRTTIYNNEIRVDNVQHNLMGQLNILRYMEPSEFHP